MSVKDTIDHWIFELSKGAMPEKGEVLIPDSLKQPNGASYIVGDNITVNFIAGGKSYQSIYKVAGIFSDYSISRNYIFLDDVSFIELQEQFKDIELIKNIYVNVKNDTGELVSDYFHKYNRRDAIVNDPALNIVRIYPEFISLYIILVSSAMLVGSVCIYTVVSLYLKDSNKDYIVFRLLGANNRQLIYIILAQLLILLFISLPPIQSLQQQSNRLSRYSSYETEAEKHYKKPFLWYAGIQTLRFKGRAAFLCLTTTVCMGLFIVTNVTFGFQSSIVAKALEGAHFTLNIDADDSKIIEAMEKGEAVGFQNDDIERFSDMAGIKYIKINQVTQQMVRLEPGKKDIVNDSKSVNGGEYYITQGRVQPFDSFEMKHLEKFLVAGRLDNVDSNENDIILQDDSWRKSKSSSYQVGDKLVLQGVTASSELMEYTIKAIVKGVPRQNDSMLNIYMAFSAFDNISGINPVSLDIYSDTEKISEVRDALNKASREGGYVVKDNSEKVEVNYKLAKALSFFGLILSSIILLLCTVLLLCYYTYYYKTRHREFRCLGAIGCSERMITRIIINESIIYSLISATACLLVSYMVSYYIYTKVSVYPQDFDWKIPWAQMGISVFIIIMVNIISVYSSIKRINGLSLVINDGEQ